MTQPNATPTLFEHLGGVYGIAKAVDILTERLHRNKAANENY